MGMNCKCNSCLRENRIPMIIYAFSNSHCVVSRLLRSALE